MDSQNAKITLYAKRSFGGKMGAIYDFMKENWKVLVKWVTVFMLPICLLQGWSLNNLMEHALSIDTQLIDLELEEVTVAFYVGHLLLVCLGFVLLGSLLFALVRLYNERENRLQGLTLAELKPLLQHNFRRLLCVTLLGALLAAIAGGAMFYLSLLSWYTLLFTLPLLVAFFLPMVLWGTVYVLEDLSLFESLKKAYRLGFATWGGLFLMVLVMSIIGNLLYGVTMTPWYVGTLVKYFFSVSEAGNEVMVSLAYSCFLYVLAILQSLGVYWGATFSLMGNVFQYGHASEVMDSISVTSEI